MLSSGANGIQHGQHLDATLSHSHHSTIVDVVFFMKTVLACEI